MAGAAVVTLWDYKFTRLETSDSLDQLHERVARRWYDVCCTNAGLYIKLGQQIATMNHVLPAPYLKYFSQLNDRAPSTDYATVSRIVSEEFGVASPDDVFDDFERAPIASASIAQVHRAKMKDGRQVAVKVQKPEVRVNACVRACV
jgi:aarF domain-containing kinase